MMKILEIVKEKSLIDRACESLTNRLAEVPFIRLDQLLVEPSGYALRPDILAKLILPDGELTLVVEVKYSGEPRIVREAIEQISRMTQMFPRAYAVFVAPYISPESAAILAERNTGYIDFAGNCLLSFWPIFIKRQDYPNPRLRESYLRSFYSTKATRVIRVLLMNFGRIWRISELARESQVSIGQVANVKKLLEDREWLESSKSGMTLKNPEVLLTEWAEKYDYGKNKVVQFYSLKKVSEVEADLAEICEKKGISYALTGFSAGSRLAPFVRYQRAMSYVAAEEDVFKLQKVLDLKEVAGGANLSLILPYDEGVFYGKQRKGKYWVASSIQTYLDLKSAAGRGEEAAEFLLERVIKPKWR